MIVQMTIKEGANTMTTVIDNRTQLEKDDDAADEAICKAETPMNRVQEDDDLQDAAGSTTIYRPIIVIEQTDDNEQLYRLHLEELDPHGNKPKLYGIILSDLLDHIAAAYHRITGRDGRDIRYDIMKVFKDEDRFKTNDPKRGRSRGTILSPIGN
jgi:hypothetical protein